ncbi:MAG: TIM barrel protein [Phocaeicola sp.]|uniref:TIM barrel protein n=1 Tax=Phocaeicola TaxID=909656 RepID=UPI00234ECBDB|nr:TIM barrel protein [Phocaeicola oris]MCE2616273.1 TIM barrel protein [Phocaeicola oris]
MKVSRRSFLKTGLASTALLATGNLNIVEAGNPAVSETKKEKKTNPFELSCAGYTFVNFDIDTTLKTLQKCDIHNLCIKDFHLPLNATDDQIAAFHNKLASFGVTGYGVGPIYMNNKEEVDNAFAYAKRVGVNVMVGVPSYEILPYVSDKMKEYPDLYYAIHLHGPDIDRFQTATVIWDKVKDLDPRIGMCLDIGHDFRAGCDPIADLEKYHSRIFDMHIKDESEPTKQGHCMEIGRGKIDFPALIRMLRKVNYTGKLSLEYEKDMKDPFLGIAESYGYLKALCDNA